MLYLGVEHFLPSQAVRRHRSLLLPLPQCLVYYEHKVTALLYENTYSFLSKEHKAGIISLHSGSSQKMKSAIIRLSVIIIVIIVEQLIKRAEKQPFLKQLF